MKKIFVIFFSIILFLAQPTLASDLTSTSLNSDTINKGYTVQLANKRFKVGIAPQSLNVNTAQITLVKLGRPADLPLTDNISPVYSFDIDSQENIDLAKPIWLKIKTNKFSRDLLIDYDIVFKYWDDNYQDWITIPSQFNSRKRVARAAIHLTYAQVAVFLEAKDYQIGTATWYNWYGAASNAYPYGTKLKVTDLDNQKSVIVEVVSTGPFNQHIIDLPKEAFAELEDPAVGIIRVKVQPL